MSPVGTWDVRIRTPIGTIEVVYTFSRSAGSDGNGDGGIAGVAVSRGETVALQCVVVDGARVTWRQSITRPLRLDLEFDVVVDGDTLDGHSRAGRLPRSAVTGTRRAPAIL